MSQKISNDTSLGLRIELSDLPSRSHKTTDKQLQEILKRVGGKEGNPCEKDCDCVMGLICRQGACIRDW